MLVFISEYCVGGAADHTAAPSMKIEGMAMLAAVVRDVACLPSVSVVTTLERGISHSLDCRIIEVESAENEKIVFESLLHAVDAALVIAPETGGILAERCRWVRAARVNSWNCEPDTIELCGDKLRLADHLQKRGVPTISTRSVDFDSPPQWLTHPVVLKPRDGAGSSLTFLIHSQRDWNQAIELIQTNGGAQDFIVQPFVAGKSLSVAVIVNLQNREVECLEVSEQIITDDGRFHYLGGRIPARITMTEADRVYELVRAACRTIPGLRGYVGFDLILDSCGFPTIVEINPRLTTSYVGYSQFYSTRLPECWLSKSGLPPKKNQKQSSVEFSPLSNQP